MWLLSSVLTVIHLALIAGTGNARLPWLLPASLIIAVIAAQRACVAALEWGDSVKAAFDVFLPTLARRFGFLDTITRDEERQRWIALSQAIVYRLPSVLPERVRRQAQPVTESSDARESAYVLEPADALGSGDANRKQDTDNEQEAYGADKAKWDTLRAKLGVQAPPTRH